MKIDNDEIDDFARTVNIKGVGHLYGLAKGDDESEEDFKKRIVARATAQPKTRDEYNSELLDLLKNHFLERLCWWSVSNNGNDFEIEMTDSGMPMQPCIVLRIYPSGKPFKAGEP